MSPHILDNMTPRKHLRELFNLRHTKCRFCERSKADGIVEGGVRRLPKVKPLFHARPWMTQSQCFNRQTNTYRDRLAQEIENIAEEVEEMRSRFEEVRRDPRMVREYVRLLYTQSGSRFEEMDTTERRY